MTGPGRTDEPTADRPKTDPDPTRARVLGVLLDPAGETPDRQVRLRPGARWLVGAALVLAPVVIGAILFAEPLLRRLIHALGG